MILNDRVALVTGASRGIGEVTARVLAQRGAKVAVSARSVGDLERVAADITVCRRCRRLSRRATFWIRRRLRPW